MASSHASDHPKPPLDNKLRQRKAHRKSRKGCANCKLRRVKCDETQPSCLKCKDYGVACNYGISSSNELQMLGQSTFSLESAKKTSSSMVSQMTQVMFNDALQQSHVPSMHGDRSLQLGPQEMELFNRFFSRTVYTIGTSTTNSQYKHALPLLAATAPYLMHIVLTMAMMHDRYVTGGFDTVASTSEMTHRHKSIILFQKTLSKPLKHSDKDALWATAALLGATTFTLLDGSDPEKVWPLKPADYTDLEWLRMSDGKRIVWQLTEPWRADSLFGAIAPDHVRDVHGFSHAEPDLEGFPAAFADLLNLDKLSTRHNNPYHQAASMVSRLVKLECNYENIMKFLSFMGNVHPNFKPLLEHKDPRALLLLAYWFGSVCQYNAWWMRGRALLTCRSICIYLERFCSYDERIIDLLLYPRERCGLGPLTTASRHSSTTPGLTSDEEDSGIDQLSIMTGSSPDVPPQEAEQEIDHPFGTASNPRPFNMKDFLSQRLPAHIYR